MLSAEMRTIPARIGMCTSLLAVIVVLRTLGSNKRWCSRSSMPQHVSRSVALTGQKSAPGSACIGAYAFLAGILTKFTTRLFPSSYDSPRAKSGSERQSSSRWLNDSANSGVQGALQTLLLRFILLSKFASRCQVLVAACIRGHRGSVDLHILNNSCRVIFLIGSLPLFSDGAVYLFQDDVR